MQRVLYAPNIHQGGGRSLLLPVLQAVANDPSLLLMLDMRMKLPEGLELQGKVFRVAPSLLGRLAAEWWLERHLQVRSSVLAMGNLPPLFAHQGMQCVFIQNRYLIDPAPNWSGFPWKVVLRLKLECWWLRSRLRGNMHLLVQTPSMQSMLKASLHRHAALMPFVASMPSMMVHSEHGAIYDFIYVASGEPHKNHRNLILAWVELAKKQVFLSLALTLDTLRFPELCQWITELTSRYQLRITLLGECPVDQMPRLYAISRALIYPSRYESFGLPLLEAVSARLPILAADEAYVHDVVKPTAVFDAGSPLSIAEAVRDFSYAPARINIQLLTADEFLRRTLYKEVA